ncbi:sugar transferase [Ornithinibacillus halophilus]|uniref:Sugar transferase involved in LPS biosynthesis (Colanic, teichoic acid) n=1 Tax=Ornithinibacillus halophilus TaxID=930117 RepID=A0A1M5KMG9_9BACI|nr:sugar transferase [Ornithinibacillus halophilus]SHG53393.1 Sugar transferase involved in LPS biosynthesis (colanic, teichoic acid) [Ornithinibacillus halophilus]
MSLQESVQAREKSESHFYINLLFMVKRLIDIIMSIGLIIITIPIFLFICYRLAKKEGKPIFKKELCVGKNGKQFIKWSFRTTTIPSQVIRSLPPHPFPHKWEEGVPDHFRVLHGKHVAYTMTGEKLRKYGFDKIPQFYNVLKGDMSLIGPSPEVVEVADYYNSNQLGRLKVRPGMTGYAQVHRLTNEKHGEKVKYDLHYINNISYKFETKIFFQAIKQLIKKK